MLICRVDEETARRTDLEKVRRELDNQVEELREDLDVEKSARLKVEKQKRELAEVNFRVFFICKCLCSSLSENNLIFHISLCKSPNLLQ